MSAIEISKLAGFAREERQAKRNTDPSGYFSGIFKGYTTDSNGASRWLVLVDGSLIKCKGITNASVAIGQRCSVGRPKGGTPFAKVMVR